MIYLSPVPWASFAQRPHKFVSWFQRKYGGRVLWYEPYATRFPSFSDVWRVKSSNSPSTSLQIPDWLTVVSPGGLAIEPLPGSKVLNNFLWQAVLKQASGFAVEGECILAIGKPSVLAAEILKALPHCKTLYDAMDDFPAFYSGLSQFAMKRRERNIVALVDAVWASSTLLYQRWSSKRNNVHLVYNGLDLDIIQSARPMPINKDRRIFGYIGTIGKWFDWEIVIALADLVPRDIVRIIGPVFKPASRTLPDNIELLPPREHARAIAEMACFDVGLIPFLRNNLTESVDPIKYYEYRSFGIPVISTSFGEMNYRKNLEGVHIVDDINGLRRIIPEACKDIRSREINRDFVEANSWAARFNQTGL
ncbi:glycosyl transferase [Brucella intermedia]|nr:glycosyl transferase [Brucella intermedia]